METTTLNPYSSLHASFDMLHAWVQTAKRIAIITHLNPDGDGLGSMLALRSYLDTLGKEASAFLPSEPSKHFAFMHLGEIHRDPQELISYDLVIMLDCSTPLRVQPFDQVILSAPHLAIIDHHVQGDIFPNALCIYEPQAPATGELIYAFLEHVRAPWTLDMARAIYTAIATDTGFFRYDKVRPYTHQIAAYMLQLGVQPLQIAQHLDQHFSMQDMRLLEIALSRIHIDPLSHTLMSHLTYSELTDVQDLDTSLILNILRGLKEVDIVVFAKEVHPDQWRTSFRTHTALDLSRFTARFGGGGHQKAAACVGYGSWETWSTQILDQIRAEQSHVSL